MPSYSTLPDATAALVALLVTFVVWDDYRHREPLLVAASTGMGLFGFLSVWPYYPFAGAILALAGPVISLGAVISGWAGLAVGGVWDDYPVRMRAAVVVACLIALDDAVEHAFGVWTPLDALWGSGLYDRAPLVVGVLAAFAGAAVVWSVYTEDG